MSQIAKSQPERYLGKYKIVSKLGQGAMGMVYKGFDPSIERYVALKTVNSHILAMDDSTIQSSLARFKQEAKIAGRLNHPNIVSVYEYGEDKNTIFIAMEFVEGRELKQVLEAQPVFNSVSTAVKQLMVPLLKALQHSHDNGVVHRDIKPGNIIVTPNGDIKVTDFGIAKIDSSDLTQMGTLLGTPSYMSPEMLNDKGIDARTDLFSAGIIFYRCLVGRKPFEGSPQQVMNKIATHEHIPPSVLNSRLPPEIDRFMDKALAKDPDQRYQSASAMLMDLKRLAGQESFASPPDPSKREKKVATKEGTTDSLASYRTDQLYLQAQYQNTDRSSTTPLIVSIVFLIMVIIAALYAYYDRFAPDDNPRAVADLTVDSNLMQFPLESEKSASEINPGAVIDPGPVVNPSPAPDTGYRPLVLTTPEENVRGLKKALENSAGRITMATARSALKLKIAFVNKAESYTVVPDSIVNQIMVSDRVFRVTQGPADLICTLTQTKDGLTVNLKNRFLINDQDRSFPLGPEPGDNGEGLVKIRDIISKLYAFNTFDLLKSLMPASDKKAQMVLSGSEDNTLFIGNKTNICIHPDQEAYLILLNVNSKDITMLFPHFLNQENHIQKGQYKCSGSMDIYPPSGTEMIVSFLLTNKDLIQKFGYSLSEKTNYYSWNYDQGEAFEFCEEIVVQLLNTSGKNWSADNRIVQIKKTDGKGFL